MASNSINTLTYNFENLILNQHSVQSVDTIENQNFKSLDQILQYNGTIYIVDWHEDSKCIHVLNIDFVYQKKLTHNNEYFQWISIVKIFNSEYLAVLTEKAIRFIDINSDEFNWHPQFIDLKRQDIRRLSLRKPPRLYGLVQEQNYLHFIETKSKTLISYSISDEEFDFKPIRLPRRFKIPCLRDFKIRDSKLFFVDYFIDLRYGNDCIHIFNNKIDKIEYIQTIGLDIIQGPYSLAFKNDILYVCERKRVGSIKGFDCNQNYQLTYDFNLTELDRVCSFPYYFCEINEFYYLTQAFGDQYNYTGSNIIFKFKLIA